MWFEKIIIMHRMSAGINYYIYIHRIKLNTLVTMPMHQYNCTTFMHRAHFHEVITSNICHYLETWQVTRLEGRILAGKKNILWLKAPPPPPPQVPVYISHC